jgi:hypothetical protein
MQVEIHQIFFLTCQWLWLSDMPSIGGSKKKGLMPGLETFSFELSA